jgi:nucleoid DNA-binding protein
MEDCAMSAGHLITDEQWKLVCHVQNGSVLNVGPASNLNGMNIGPDYHLIPDTRVFADGNCSHQTCSRSNKGRFGDGRLVLQVFRQPAINLVRSHHLHFSAQSRYRKAKLAEIFGKNCASRLTNLANSVDKGQTKVSARESAPVKVSEAIAFRAARLHSMNKVELVESVKKQLGSEISKAEAEKAVTAVINAIKTGVKKDKVVQLVGFGTFKVVERKARKGVNPKTLQQIKIPKSKTVKFVAGKDFKTKV